MASRRTRAPASHFSSSGCRPSSCSIWPLVCPPLVVPETDGLACTQRRNHLDKCGFQCSVVFFRLRRPPARWPTKVMLKDCQETESLHQAGFVVVQLWWVVGYCVGMKSCGLRRTRKRAVGLLSSVAMCCPKGYPEQRETKATSCVAVTAYAMFARGATRATRDGRDV